MDFISFGYALIVAFGGIMGYIKAGSMASLISGLLFGLFSGIGAYKVSNNPQDYIFLLVTCGALFVLMAYRFSLSGKFMPAGFVAAISLAMVIRLGFRMIK